MCGIFFSFNKKKSIDVSRCINALEILNERGPDNSFYKFHKNIFLGQTTLAITSHNYIGKNNIHESLDKNFQLLFNGEIYNYKELRDELISKFNCNLKSSTDTEVLVNLFSFYKPKEIIKKLNGMYAFVLFDKKNNKIFFSRDHIGEKILYLYNQDDELIISSEIKAIKTLKENLNLNIVKLKEYFHTRHLLTNVDTCFKNIHTIKPGILYEYDITNDKKIEIYDHSINNIIDRENYYNFKKMNDHDIFEETLKVFRNSAKEIKPDINYTSVCSGGIDSSLVSAILYENEKKPEKFIALNFDYKDNSFYNIINIEKELNFKVNRLNIDIDKYAEIINKVYNYNYSPLATHSFISQYFVSNYCKKNNIKVLLTGDGGDELFGGYEFYKNLINFKNIPNLSPSTYSNLQYDNIFFDNEIYNKQSENLSKIWNKSLKAYDFIDNIDERIIQSTLLLDSNLQLESVGIRSSDMMSMINSVESRSLFLMKKVIKLALNLPIKYKINQNEDEIFKTKVILKKILKYLCNENEKVIVNKQGFSGFPNEAGKLILGDAKYSKTKDLLKISNQHNDIISKNRSIEWKFINIELFLNNYL